MIRPVTLVSGQYGDIPFEQLCALVADIGYDGIEAACWAHVDVDRVLNEEGYAEEFLGTLETHGLKLWAISSHLIGQCVGDKWDPRLDNFAPTRARGPARGNPAVGGCPDDNDCPGGAPVRDRCRHGLPGFADLELLVLLPADHRGDG